MATINYTQTDTDSSGSGNSCSGSSSAGFPLASRLCTNGGTPGTGTPQFGLTGSTSGWVIRFKLTIDAQTSWNSGTWTWRLNITTANMNLTIDQVLICRMNSSEVAQETLGSATSLGISLGSTGVKSGTISCSAATSPASTDFIAVDIILINGSMNPSQGNMTPNQNIDSPFTTPTGTNLLPFCIAPQGTR